MKRFSYLPKFKPSAAIPVVPLQDAEDYDEFVHECHELAAKMMFPVVAEWKGEELLITHFERCPCKRCNERNPGLTFKRKEGSRERS